MKILVIGKGGREHALVTALRESPSKPVVYAWPGSDAIHSLAERVPATDLEGVAAFLKKEGIDLCVAGEESCLVQGPGIAALCEREGVLCWGPPKQSAQLEASKEFAKGFLVRHGIPTAAYRTAGSLDEALAGLDRIPVVIKFDGLAAGKGVAVCETREEAAEFLNDIFVRKIFGEGRVVIEERLTGPELSVFCSIADGRFHVLMPARDYKRIRNNDEGPNTGGMGAVAGPGIVPPETVERIVQTIVRPTVEGLNRDGLPYRGFLYFGLMLTPDGPKVIEYNCRFGDPECEAVMPLLGGDFATYLLEAAGGRLRPDLLETRDGWSVCVILASAGYPASSRSGDRISGLEAVAGARIYHCGTRRLPDGAYETAGGRVLAVVAQADSLAEARTRALAEAEKIAFDGRQRRTDIGVLHFADIAAG